MSTVYAGNINFGPPGGGFSGPGGGAFSQTNDPALGLEGIITTVIGVMTIVAGIWFFFLLLTGGIGIIASGGDKGSYENARRKMTTGLVGLVVVVISVFMVSLVGQILGVDFLNVAQFIAAFTP